MVDTGSFIITLYQKVYRWSNITYPWLCMRENVDATPYNSVWSTLHQIMAQMSRLILTASVLLSLTHALTHRHTDRRAHPALLLLLLACSSKHGTFLGNRESNSGFLRAVTSHWIPSYSRYICNGSTQKGTLDPHLWTTEVVAVVENHWQVCVCLCVHISLRSSSTIYALEVAAENYYKSSECVCTSLQDKATIFPMKLNGPVLVKSFPLLAVTDLKCFLPAVKMDIMLLL